MAFQALSLARRLLSSSPRLRLALAAAPQEQPLWRGRSVSQFHASSLAAEGYSPLGELTPAQAQRKKLLNSLLYRAKQRGFLELDLMVGGWAEQNLGRLSDEELASFAVVLDCENPDLFQWLTGQAEPSPELSANPAFLRLQAHVAAQLNERARSDTRGALGKPWVRGWNDSGKPSSGNQQ